MKKFLSISLSFILLFSNAGLAMTTHYCGGQPVKAELTIGHGHLGCDMPGMDMGLKEGEQGVNTSSCCENQYQFLKVKDDYISCNVQISSNTNLAFVVLAHNFFKVKLAAKKPKLHYTHYSPPLLLRDIPILNQVFLI